MSQRPLVPQISAVLPAADEITARLLARIRAEILELDTAFGADDDLFHAGLDSMAIMQVILILEDEFGVRLPDSSIKRETFATARSIATVVAPRTTS